MEFRASEVALFALDESGGWRELRSVRVDAPNLNDSAADMRRAATKMTGEPSPGVDVWLPEEQVANLELDPGAKNPRRAAAERLAERSAATPDELVVDAIGHAGGHAACAAERIVVEEAQSYIRRWGFRPLRVTTRHGHPAFPKGPTFAKPPVGVPVLIGGAAAALLVATLGWALISGGGTPPTVADDPAPTVLAETGSAAPLAETAPVETQETPAAETPSAETPSTEATADEATADETPTDEATTGEAPDDMAMADGAAADKPPSPTYPPFVTTEETGVEAADETGDQPVAESQDAAAPAAEEPPAPALEDESEPSPPAAAPAQPTLAGDAPSGVAPIAGLAPDAAPAPAASPSFAPAPAEGQAPPSEVALSEDPAVFAPEPTVIAAPAVLVPVAAAPPPAGAARAVETPAAITLVSFASSLPAIRSELPETPRDAAPFSVPTDIAAELRLADLDDAPPAAPPNARETRVAALGDAATAPRRTETPAERPDAPPETAGATPAAPAPAADDDDKATDKDVEAIAPPAGPAASDAAAPGESEAEAIERRRLTVTSDPRVAAAQAEPEEDPEAPGPGAVARAPAPAARPEALDMTPSSLALAAAPAPKPRPASIRPRQAPAASSGGAPARTASHPQRSGPTGPGVANAATLNNAMALEQMNLIGVFGSNGGRRALLRLPNGEVMRVKKGAVVDGWVVSRIDKNAMRITRGGEAQVLKVVQ